MAFKHRYTGYEKAPNTAPPKPKKYKQHRNFGRSECKECSKEFNKKRKMQLFCSTKCRVANWMKEHPRIVVTLYKEK